MRQTILTFSETLVDLYLVYNPQLDMFPACCEHLTILCAEPITYLIGLGATIGVPSVLRENVQQVSNTLKKWNWCIVLSDVGNFV